MKELTAEQLLKPEIQNEIRLKHEVTKLGTIKKRPGLYLFQLKDGFVSKANMRTESIKTKRRSGFKRHKVEHEIGTQYVQALNLKNAIKKFYNIGFSIRKEQYDLVFKGK